MAVPQHVTDESIDLVPICTAVQLERQLLGPVRPRWRVAIGYADPGVRGRVASACRTGGASCPWGEGVTTRRHLVRTELAASARSGPSNAAERWLPAWDSQEVSLSAEPANPKLLVGASPRLPRAAMPARLSHARWACRAFGIGPTRGEAVAKGRSMSQSVAVAAPVEGGKRGELFGGALTDEALDSSRSQIRYAPATITRSPATSSARFRCCASWACRSRRSSPTRPSA